MLPSEMFDEIAHRYETGLWSWEQGAWGVTGWGERPRLLSEFYDCRSELTGVCAGGALQYFFEPEEDGLLSISEHRKLLTVRGFLLKAINSRDIAIWNDASARTVEEVITAFRNAVELARQGGQ